MKYSDIPQFLKFNYEIDAEWDYLETILKGYEEDEGLDLNPDFQRAHIWTEKQQVDYIEYVLKGGEVGKQIIFNNEGGRLNWGRLTLIDGKQRLEAARKFMRDKLRVFGCFYSEITGRRRLLHASFKFRMCCLTTREEILQLYLNINAGGTPHTKEELDKVRKMLKKEKKLKMKKG